MSHQPSTSGNDPHSPEHEDLDAVDWPKVIVVGVVSLAIFALGTFWAARILHQYTAHLEEERGIATPLVQERRPEIGIVDQVPFISDHRIDEWRKERAERLEGYGWVDQSHAVAHVPIEKAMDMVVAGAAPKGAPK